MRIVFAVVVALHGLVHLLGPCKAFGWAEVNQLRHPVAPLAGGLWLATAVLFVGASIAIVSGVRWWWCLAAPAVLLSQFLILRNWGDARFGTLANLLIAVPLALLAADARPGSFGSRFTRDSGELLVRSAGPAPSVTEADLAALPPLMQTYLRRAGAVGRPRVRNMRVQFDAQMRSSATAAWMVSTAKQYEFFDPPARLFHMSASRAGVPIDVLHEYVGGAATFQVRLAGLIPMIEKSGTGITHDETVTLMNDILVLAPAAVFGLPFAFEPIDGRSLRATFNNAGFAVAATLTFDAAGDLVGFVSSDRAHDREGGPARWSTPISGYAEVDGVRVGTHGDANWIDPSGEWTYGRFVVRSIAYNVAE